MRIGFDAKRLFHNFTGLGNYSRTLVSNLARMYPENQYLLFAQKTRDDYRTREFFSNPHIKVVQPKIATPTWRIWGMSRDIEQHKVDIYHGLSHEIPFGFQKRNIPSLVTIHDLTFLVYPKQYKFTDRHIYNLKFSYACKNANLIIADSNNTRNDIIENYHTPPDRVRVVPLACDKLYYAKRTPNEQATVRAEYNLPTNYFLYVGSIIERKRLLSVAQALRTFPESLRPHLVIVGRGREYKTKVLEYLKKHGMENSVTFAPQITPLHLPAVYQGALALVYPSVYEGFGLPVVEALFSGTPVITSNMSCLPEAAGPNSLQVDPNNISELAHAMEQVRDNSALRSEMIIRGLEYAQRFHENTVTAQMMDIYKTMLDRT